MILLFYFPLLLGSAEDVERRYIHQQVVSGLTSRQSSETNHDFRAMNALVFLCSTICSLCKSMFFLILSARIDLGCFAVREVTHVIN